MRSFFGRFVLKDDESARWLDNLIIPFLKILAYALLNLLLFVEVSLGKGCASLKKRVYNGSILERKVDVLDPRCVRHPFLILVG